MNVGHDRFIVNKLCSCIIGEGGNIKSYVNMYLGHNRYDITYDIDNFSESVQHICRSWYQMKI